MATRYGATPRTISRDIYNCRINLPPIFKKDGSVARNPASTYNGANFYDLQCKTSLSLDVMVTAVVGAVCGGAR